MQQSIWVTGGTAAAAVCAGEGLSEVREHPLDPGDRHRHPVGYRRPPKAGRGGMTVARGFCLRRSRILSWGVILTLWVMAAIGCVSGRGSRGGAEERSRDAGRTGVFVCEDGTEFVAQTAGGRAWVFLPSGTRVLPRLGAPPTERFGDGEVTFTWEEESASLEAPGGGTLRCRNDRRRAVWEAAKLRGVDFRAVGNEPGWVLEIIEQARIELTAEHGASHQSFELPAPLVDRESRVTTYRARDDEQELVLVIEGRRCTDTMSGEEFEVRVTVRWDGRTLRGCGRALH